MSNILNVVGPVGRQPAVGQPAGGGRVAGPPRSPADWRSQVRNKDVVRVIRRPPGGAEILWIALDPGRRGQRLGTALLDRVLDELAAAGVSVGEAKTLDASADYPPYAATRAFWEHKGFVHIDTIDPLPGWAPGNSAAIYVAALRPTR